MGTTGPVVVRSQLPPPLSKMRAVVYKKPFEVAIEEVERPTLTHPDDIIVKGIVANGYQLLRFVCEILL